MVGVTREIDTDLERSPVGKGCMECTTQDFPLSTTLSDSVKHLTKNTPTYVTEDYRGHDAVMVSHSNITFEEFVVPTQSLRPLRQLRLAERWYGSVRDVIFWDADVSGDRSSNERVHVVVTELLEHICGLAGVRTNVPVREGVQCGKG